MFRVGRTPIVVERLLRAVRDPGAGAVVVFVGTTRNENAGRRVVRLEYEAYTQMAVSEMRGLAAEARAVALLEERCSLGDRHPLSSGIERTRTRWIDELK